MPDLNKILNYNLIGVTPIITARAQNKINTNTIISHKCWQRSFCTDFKQEVRVFYARRQGQKCAYCRVTLTPDGYAEPIDHITPRVLKPFWMFVLHNLVLSCGGCNTNKKDNHVLIQPHSTYGHPATSCSNAASDYLIFNPHYDSWSDHFEVEEGVFLKPKPGTKGPFTYNLCHMFRYHIVIDYINQLNLLKPISCRTINKRILKEKDPKRLAHLRNAIEYLTNGII